MCLGKYKEFGATNANMGQLLGIFVALYLSLIAGRFASRFS